MKNPTTKTILIAVVALFTLIGGVVFVWNNCQIQITEKPDKPASLTEKEARTIAEKSCIKGGEALSTGSYNPNTKTWWFDANLNATREGCNPACVVNGETKTAEINWRCTGLREPDPNKCGIENCHGLDIVCGFNLAEMCTTEYQLGDRCRQYAQCSVANGRCQQIENSQFTACKTCAQKCQKDYPNDPEKVFTCESRCGE
jgi:hypothetical protein